MYILLFYLKCYVRWPIFVFLLSNGFCPEYTLNVESIELLHPQALDSNTTLKYKYYFICFVHDLGRDRNSRHLFKLIILDLINNLNVSLGWI